MFKMFPGLVSVVAATMSLATPPALHAQTSEAAAARIEIEATFGFLPSFVQWVPEASLPGTWQALRDLEFNPGTALPPKIKSLIALAVAAQVPCAYCTYIDTKAAIAEGATDQEIEEALGMAAVTRLWSTVLNGLRLDSAQFAADVEGIVAHAAAMGSQPAPKAIEVVDAQSAYRDMEATLGRVPGFMRGYPAGSIAGAWKQFKNLQVSTSTALPGKYKELIGLAVAAQIPCTYCIDAHTAFAQANGATNEELSEAVAISALVRHWSTVITGSQQDLDAFKKEADRMLEGAAAMAQRSKK